MKRRGFLGLLGGAAVAGPAAAKNAVTQVMPLSGAGNLVGALTAHSYDGGPVPTQLGSGGSLLANFDRAMKLKRLISGEEQMEVEPYEAAQVKRVITEHDIHALRSISAPHKVRIMHREAMKLERERQKSYWIKELLGLEGSRP